MLGNGDAFVSGADVHFNGSVDVSSNGLVVTNGAITVEGSATGPLSNYTPDPTPNQPRITNPLADYPARPDYSALTAKTNPCGTGSTHGPGIYCGYSFGNDPCALQPGLYVITGTFDLSGNATITGSGITLFFTCSTSGVPERATRANAGGTIDNTGNGNLGITAPTVDPYKGMAIWYDLNNEALMRMNGNGATGFTGTIYAPAATMRMRGNGCSSTFNSLIIVSDLEMDGNPPCLRSSYTQTANVEIPPGALHLDQ